jgi:diacylglycerol kinase (ATP)
VPPILARQREAVLLVNTRSLKGAELLEQAQKLLAESELEVTTALGFSKAPELFARAQEERDSGKLVIVGGGDGTLSAVANILAKSESVMGILPLGTGNAFARDLNIPKELDEAIAVLTDGVETEVDLGVYDGGYFINVATIGLTATVAKTLTVPLKRRFGRFVYAIGIAKALKEMHPFKARISTENGVTEVNAVQIVIGNGRYHGGPLPLSPTAAITSGKLRLYAVESSSTAGLIKYALLLPTGFQGVLKSVHSEETEGGTIETDPTQSIVIDGEIAAKTPLRFSVAPLALKVMTPKSFKG